MKLVGENLDIKMLRRDDKYFIIRTGRGMYPRAGFEISKDAPPEWRDIIIQAMQRGYIIPVATIRSKELMMEVLCD